MARPAATLDEAQLNELYGKHQDAVLSYLVKYMGVDEHLAEDFMQETFLRAWRSPIIVRNRDKSNHTWLIRVAHNLVVDRRRYLACRPEEIGDVESPHNATEPCEYERLMTAMSLYEAMLRLPPRGRETLLQLFVHERSPTEAAEVLGVPVGTIKSRAHYALRTLRRYVADDEACAA